MAPIQDPQVKALALRAVDAAMSAGATYVDVRLTRTRRRRVAPNMSGGVSDREELVAGTRALVNGCWGFASGPVWDADEMVRLGREAVHQARAMAFGPARQMDLAPVSAVNDGHWTMPVEIDPFEVPPFEIHDYLASLRLWVGRFPGFSISRIWADFQHQEKAFASSVGSYCTQRLYLTTGTISLRLRRDDGEFEDWVEQLTPAGLGWELFKGERLRGSIEQLMEEMKFHLSLPAKPVDVGRYDAVCDAMTVASLLDATLGRATELDRSLGYEANAGGTTYLSDPVAMLGSYEAGAPSVNVSANRSEPGGAATVRWDDEGVAPDDFTLIDRGTLVDFQTTRESANWLAEYYAAQGRTVRSHGCANAPSALEPQLLHPPNLSLAPGREPLDFDGAIAEMQDGIAVKKLDIDMDFQALNGLGTGSRIYEVKNGKRVARIVGAGLLFRAPELWKGLKAVGGPDSLGRYGFPSLKGEPQQRTYHSVTAPPAVFEQFTVIDVLRKA
jgi:TldD protein